MKREATRLEAQAGELRRQARRAVVRAVERIGLEVRFGRPLDPWDLIPNDHGQPDAGIWLRATIGGTELRGRAFTWRGEARRVTVHLQTVDEESWSALDHYPGESMSEERAIEEAVALWAWRELGAGEYRDQPEPGGQLDLLAPSPEP